MQYEAQETRLRFWQIEKITPAIALDDRTHSSPVAAVIGKLHVVMRGESVLEPVQYYSSELAGLLKIERQRLLRAGGWITLPGSRECSVERVGGCRSWLCGGRLQEKRGVARRWHWQLTQAELIET